MSRGKRAIVLAAVVWALTATMGPACFGGQETAAPAAQDLSALARQARPAIGVLVTFDAGGKPLSQGTAFFVRANGVGITCYHVLSGAASALVRMENGALFPVEGRLAADPARDLALFKVTGKDLPTVPLGDSSTLSSGQRVVAITAPEGLGNTVADGLVSAMQELPSGSVVQVSVPLSPGSSGGPIFDLSGRVVAVVLTEGQALNFAIPINAAKPLLAQPGSLTLLAPAKQPSDLEDWLREHPTTSGQAGAYDLWLQGMSANADGRYQEALGPLRAALVQDPTLYQAHCCLGATYRQLGRWQEALDAYKEAIRLKPDLGEAHYNLGVAYGNLGRWQEAVDAYKQAIRLEPDLAEAHNNLGQAYENLGRWQEAVDASKEAIRLKPDLAEAHYGLGWAYGNLGRWQEALEAFQQATRLKPDDADAHYNIGVAYGKLGRWQEALGALKEAIRLKPDLALAHNKLGVAYAHLDRYQEALEAFKEAIRLKPDYAAPHFNLGQAYGNLGRWQEALDEYRILKDLDAGLAEKLFKLLYP
jgi:tetratricopeptide (TPR) repeat protein